MLVQLYDVPVQMTATLLLVNNLIGILSSTFLGYLVARLGERLVLTINFIGLIGVFLGYAYVRYVPVLFALFVLDHVFFGFNLAVESYFQKIALSLEEITSNVSMAQTINHISALVVPVLGGLLWQYVSPSAPFLVGVGVAFISLVLVQFIRVRPVPSPVSLAAEKLGPVIYLVVKYQQFELQVALASAASRGYSWCPVFVMHRA
jgi:predicted MFS family arabinose efflux permease